MNFKDELHHLVDALSEEDAADALDYLRWLVSDEEETLNTDERARLKKGRREISQGEYVAWEDVKHELGL